METVDEEFLAAALDFIDRQHKAGQAVLLLLQLHPHARLHAPEEGIEGKTGLGLYPDGMVEHDGHVGQLLKKLDDLGIADNTIVVYTTDNGAEVMSAGPTAAPRRSAARRRPTGKAASACRRCIRWPGVIKPGTVYNDMFAHEDFIPTFAAAAGDPDVVAKVQEGLPVGRQDIQGPPRRLQPHAVLQGRGEGIAAQGVPLLERRWRPGRHARQPVEDLLHGAGAHGPRRVEEGLHQPARTQHLQSARRPVRARARVVRLCKWMADRAFLIVPAQAVVGQWLASFKEFPIRQKPASFNLDEVMSKLQEAGKGSN